MQPVSSHICRPCLSLITQRISQKRKLENLNAKQFNDYLHKARENGIAVKIKHSAKRALPSHESEALETMTERSSIPLTINDNGKTN